MAERIRVLLLIPHLGGGGAEQVMTLLARGLSARKYDLHLGLITQARVGRDAIPPWVTVHALGARRVRNGALRLLFLVRQLRPDVVLSGIAHLNFLVLLLRPLFPRHTRVLVRQNATLSCALAAGGLPGYTRILYKLLYRHADRVLCQSPAMAEDLAQEIALAPDRIAILPNPVDLDAIHAMAQAPSCWSGPGPHLLAIGRLAPEKGFDLLLDAMARIRCVYPDADLIVAGAGAQLEALQAQARRLRIDSAVRFAGYVDNPYGFFSGASLFVLSSRNEGMPNALLEAAAAGLPLVATPASNGVVDLLGAKPGAWLAHQASADALASAILCALAALKPGQRFQHAFLSTEQTARGHAAGGSLAGQGPAIEP